MALVRTAAALVWVLLAPALCLADAGEDEACLLQKVQKRSGHGQKAIPTSAPKAISATNVSFSTVPPWVQDQPVQCLGVSDDTLVLAPCPGQNFTLVDFHYLEYEGKCLTGNSTWVGFVDCPPYHGQTRHQIWWFQLPQTGAYGPIAHCWCTGPDDCMMPCDNTTAITNTSTGLVLADEGFDFWISYY